MNEEWAIPGCSQNCPGRYGITSYAPVFEYVCNGTAYHEQTTLTVPYRLLRRMKMCIRDSVWDASVDSFSGAIRVHMSSLRRKLKSVLGYDPIMNKVGEGYKIREESNQ